MVLERSMHTCRFHSSRFNAQADVEVYFQNNPPFQKNYFVLPLLVFYIFYLFKFHNIQADIYIFATKKGKCTKENNGKRNLSSQNFRENSKKKYISKLLLLRYIAHNTVHTGFFPNAATVKKFPYNNFSLGEECDSVCHYILTLKSPFF